MRAAEAPNVPQLAATAALWLLQLLVLWIFPHVPTQDGPAHLDTAQTLLALLRGDSAVAHHYRLVLQPNVLPQYLLAALTFLSGPALAEKLFLSLFMVCLFGSLLYALSAVRRGSAFLSLFALPFAHALPTHLGLYSFISSLPVAIFTLGFWIRHGDPLSGPRHAALCGLLLLVYFCHPVALGLVLLPIGVLFLWHGLEDVAAGRIDHRGLLLRGAALFATAAPAVILLLVFTASRQLDAVPLSLVDRFLTLVNLLPLVVFGPTEAYLSTAIAVLFLGVVLYLARRRRPAAEEEAAARRPARAGIAVAAVVAAVAALVAPNSVGEGRFVVVRLAIFPFLLLCCWFATFRWTGRSRWVVIGGLALLSSALLAIRLPRIAAIDEHLAELDTVIPRLRPGSTLLPLYVGPGAAKRLAMQFDPLCNAAGRIAAVARVVNLRNLQGSYRVYAATYRRPNPGLLVLDGRLADVDLDQVRRTAGQPVDYVLVWSGDPHEAEQYLSTPFGQQLRRQYRTVSRHVGRGYLRLFALADSRPLPRRPARR